MAGPLIAIRGVRWHTRHVEAEKQAIKRELDDLGERAGPGARLQHINRRISELEDDDSAGGRIRLWIYIVSALVHHNRLGGLSRRQVRNLAKTGFAILQIEGIKPCRSRLAFLYGELHLVLSQISRKEGNHWSSAWEQQLAHYLSGEAPPGGEAFQCLSMAIRVMRLGQTDRAEQLFDVALSGGLPVRSEVRALFGRIQALRLAGKIKECEILLEGLAGDQRLDPNEQLQLAWERVVFEATATTNLRTMTHLVQRGRELFRPAYLVEAHLWTMAAAERRFSEKLPTLRYLARDRKLGISRMGQLFEAARTIEEAYEGDVPIALRLRKIGHVLESTSQLLTIEAELLVKAAVARWLARTRLYPMAALVMNDYTKLSLVCSNGRTPDSLGLLGDLVGKTWLEMHEMAPQAG